MYFFFIIWHLLTLVIPLLISIAYLTLLERKQIAAIQGRKGPNVVGIFGLLQPLADGLKLFSKELIIPNKSDVWLFIIAPILTFALSLISWIVLPISSLALNIELGILFILVISSLAVYGIIIAGWASNSNYALLGALRSAAQMISYEVSIGLLFVPLVLFISSFNFEEIISYQKSIWNLFHLLPVFILFFVSALAETNRAPFDLPEAEAELVAGYNVEYSGMAFALFFLGEYNNMIVICVIIALLFLGGWFAPLTYKIFTYDYFIWNHFFFQLVPDELIFVGSSILIYRYISNVNKHQEESRFEIVYFAYYLLILLNVAVLIQLYSPLHSYAEWYLYTKSEKFNFTFYDFEDYATLYVTLIYILYTWQEMGTGYFTKANESHPLGFILYTWKIKLAIIVLTLFFMIIMYMEKKFISEVPSLIRWPQTRFIVSLLDLSNHSPTRECSEFKYPIYSSEPVRFQDQLDSNPNSFFKVGLDNPSNPNLGEYPSYLEMYNFRTKGKDYTTPLILLLDNLRITIPHVNSSLLYSFLYFFLLPVKVFFLLYLFILTRAALPRYRYDQLMQIGWKMILPFSLVFSTCYSLYIFYFVQFEFFF
jgi:NADH-quinone oxidoreductase subunit H